MLAKSASLPVVQDVVCDLKSLGLFFKLLSKRQRALKAAIQDVNAERSQKEKIPVEQQTFKLLRDTRWVERHTKFQDLVDFYEPLFAVWRSMFAMPASPGTPSLLWKQMDC